MTGQSKSLKSEGLRSGGLFFSSFVGLSFFLAISLIGLKSLAQETVSEVDSSEFGINLSEWNVLWWSVEDSLPIYFLEEIEVYHKPSFKSKRQVRKYNRLVRRVEKVYPFSKIVEERLIILAEQLEFVETESQKKRIIKETEKLLFAEFEDEIRKMTLSEGRILVKLIDRQTGNSSYEIIREMRGSFQAFFWQSLAMLFGNNLKAEYDIVNNEQDQMIEDIVMRLERNEKDLIIH